jgi:hypothetical protein
MEPAANDMERSLLQKAVRRGNAELTDKVVQYLISVDDVKWLRKRLAVIGYEECWTYSNQLDYECKNNKLLEQYKVLACKVKNKNCDGLAYLARSFNEGQTSAMVGNNKEKTAIRSVANAVNKPVEFWEWIRSEPEYEKNKQRIDAAEKAMSKPSMERDKVIMLAAAYLSIAYPIPETEDIEPNNDPDFPYWTAIDKHTVVGDQIITDASMKIGIQPHSGKQLAFYLAGAECNQIKDSSFFKYAKLWKFNQMKFTSKQAEEKWKELKSLIIDEAIKEGELMRKRINNIKNDSDQFELSF